MPDQPKDERETDIIVRANVERYRLAPTFDPRFEEDGKAEFGFGNGARATAEVEQEEIAPAVVSKRLMFRLKLPF